MNLVGTYYKSDYDYEYKELLDEKPDFETATVINTDKYSVIGDEDGKPVCRNQVHVQQQYPEQSAFKQPDNHQ